MRTSSAGRDRLALIVGLGVCVAIWGVGRGIPFVRELYENQRGESIELAQRAAVMRYSVRSTRSLAESLAVRRKRFDGVADHLIKGATSNAAAASATAYLASLAEDHGVKLGAVQVITDTASAKELRHVSLVISATGDVTGMMHMLAALESGAKVLHVTSLAISQPQAMAPTTAPEVLSAQMTIDALALVGDKW